MTRNAGWAGSLLDRIRAGPAGLVALGFLLLVFFTGRAIAYNPGLTVGGWVLNLAPAGIVGGVLFVYLVLWEPSGGVALGRPAAISAPQFLVCTGVSLVAGFALFLVLLERGVLVWVMIGLLVSALFAVSLWWAATGSRLRGLEALVLSLPFVHFLEYELRITSVTQPTTVLLWIFAGVLALGLSVRSGLFVGSRLGKYLILVLATCLLASVLSSDPSTSIWTTYYVASMAVIFWIIVQCVRSRDDVVEFLSVVVVSGTLRIASLGYFVYLKSGAGVADISVYYGLTRWRPEWIVGWWMILLVPLCFAGVVAFRGSWRGWAAGAVLACALLISLPIVGRSTIGAVAIGLALFLLLRRGRGYVIGLVPVVLVGLIVLWPTVIQTKLMRFQEFSSLAALVASQSVRIDAWGAAIAMMRDHPLTGIGPGMWGQYVSEYATVYFEAPQERIFVWSAHNVILQQGATAGVAGLIAEIMLAVAMVWRAIGLVRAESGTRYQPIAMGLLAVVCAYWVAALIGGDALDINSFSDNGYFFWMLLGIVAAWDRVTVERGKSPLGDPLSSVP